MGARERRVLTNLLKVLIAHLLKWHCQPQLRSRSWDATIREQRLSLQDLLDDNPSLRPALEDQIRRAYRLARPPCRQGDQPGGVHLPGRMPLFGCRSPGRGVLPRLIPRRTPTLQRGSRYRRSSVTRPANDRHRRHNPMRPRPWGSVRSGLDLFPSFGAGPRHKSRPRPHFLAELTGNPAYRVADSEPAPPEVVAWDLGAGETQVITHALRHGADGLVLDDLDARRCAKAMGRSVIGTLGVVGRAKSMGRIAQFPGSKPGSCCRLDRSLFPLWLIMDSRLVRDEG